MKIEHIAIWVKDLEATKHFYETYFGAIANDKYHNEKKQFQSYFLSFQDGCRLELMHRPDILDETKSFENQKTGIVHFAMAVGSKEKVDSLTQQLQNDGYRVVGQPRTTGDGYYESVVLDPEDNIIEITV